MRETSCCELVLKWWKVLHVLAVVLTISPVLSDYTWSNKPKGSYSNWHVSAPEFEDLSIREIQAKTGQIVLLPCTVRNLGDKVVSWIRSKDLHILTSGSHTFSADNRFESVYSTRTNFWGLRIRGARISDTGRYECQVNTDPKMSLGINLAVSGNVVNILPALLGWRLTNLEGCIPTPAILPDSVMQNDAHPGYKWPNEARIKGPSEVYVREGSPVTFTCEISASSPSSATPATQSPSVPTRAPIYWLHDSKQISFDSSRGGISVETDYRDRNSVSRLRVAEVSPQDTGLYTCTQALAKPGSIRLVVLEAEHTEAMQRDAPHSTATADPCNVLHGALFIVVTSFVNVYSCNIFLF